MKIYDDDEIADIQIAPFSAAPERKAIRVSRPRAAYGGEHRPAEISWSTFSGGFTPNEAMEFGEGMLRAAEIARTIEAQYDPANDPRARATVAHNVPATDGTQ